MWNTVYVRALIDKRKKSNSEFHNMSGNDEFDQLHTKNLALRNSSASSSTNANLPVENCQNSLARTDSNDNESNESRTNSMTSEASEASEVSVNSEASVNSEVSVNSDYSNSV
ncbi:11902_t:CDS:2 [Dentiscutata heterogama]|uniref:11902_t:CDS:1 n=1 Tax=Dentiscutata heterogama TaxID=1316150 RepID=A0ACA9LPC6_9GLOM|nr:11902_t:CDS:2 [Dentiscutata heterogama]